MPKEMPTPLPAYSLRSFATLSLQGRGESEFAAREAAANRPHGEERCEATRLEPRQVSDRFAAIGSCRMNRKLLPACTTMFREVAKSEFLLVR
jgi:hypothetical protein